MTLRDAYQLAYGIRTADAIVLAEVDLGRSPYEFGQALFALGRECPPDGDERRGWLDAEDDAWSEVVDSDLVADDDGGVPAWMLDDEIWEKARRTWDALYSNEIE